MPKVGDPWFRFFPREYLDGTRDLTLEQRGAYMDAIALQMVFESPVKDDYRWLAHQMHISERKARTIVESIIEVGKLTRGDDGLTNRRATEEIEWKLSQRRANAESASARWRANAERIAKDVQSEIENQEKRQQNQGNDGCERTAKAVPRGRAIDSDIDKTLSIGDTPSSSNSESSKNLPVSETGVSDIDAEVSVSRYSEAFEAFWQAYPETRGMSKKKAYTRWSKLSAAERERAVAALPAFIAQLAERRAKDPRSTPLHAEGYLNQRRFETLLEAAPAERVVWWKDPAKVAEITPERWRQGIAQYANGIWPVDKLGPAPGSKNCVVPPDIVAELHLTEKYDEHGINRSGDKH